MMQEPNAYSRRLFLQQGLTLASTLGTVPLFVERSAHGVANPLGSALSSRPGVPEDRILVVVQLGGGNDGLNTVVPYFDDHYHRARPRIGMKAPGTPQAGNRQALQLDEDLGLAKQVWPHALEHTQHGGKDEAEAKRQGRADEELEGERETFKAATKDGVPRSSPSPPRCSAAFFQVSS